MISTALGNRLPLLRNLCTLNADLSGLKNLLKPLDDNGPSGKYYRVVFKLVIGLGSTQLQARFRWEEQVSTKL